MSTKSSPSSPARKTCPCGHERGHYLVTPEGKYTLTGWFWVTVIGVTTRPLKVSYRCRQCGETFDESTEPEDLDKLA
jgi:hypothetical protein